MSIDWTGKRVLVTGADGFIGSHLTERLAREGASIRAFTTYNSFNHWGWLESAEKDLLSLIEFFPGDIRDPSRVLEAIDGQDVVFHLASLVGIPYSYQSPDSYVHTNVGGTLNVLNACRRVGIMRLVQTSTSEVYGTAKYVPIDEEHPLQGQSPYSASKIGADMLAMSFHCSFGVPVAIIRPFNVFGPRQSARAVIPTILGQLQSGAGQIRLGALTPTRDFNYVENTVAGFLAVAECDRALGEVINIGSGRETSVGDLAAMLMEITGMKAEIITENQRVRPEKSEVDRLVCDNTRAREWTGWNPKYSLEEGLEATARWIYENQHEMKSSVYSV